MVSRGWSLLPSGHPDYWDGIAFVNRGSAATNVVVELRDKTGQVLASHTLHDLAPNAKRLVNLSTLFPLTPGSYFQIQAQQDLAMLALRGDGESSFLVPSSAQPLEVNP